MNFQPGTRLIIVSANAAFPPAPPRAAGLDDLASIFPDLPVFDEVAQDEIGNTDKYGNGGNISKCLKDYKRVFIKPAVIYYSFFLHQFPHYRLFICVLL
jgi:hypothetical protein